MTGFMHEKEFSRRTFVKGGGALSLGFSVLGSAPSMHGYVTAMTVAAAICAGLAAVIVSTSFLLPRK